MADEDLMMIFGAFNDLYDGAMPPPANIEKCKKLISQVSSSPNEIETTKERPVVTKCYGSMPNDKTHWEEILSYYEMTQDIYTLKGKNLTRKDKDELFELERWFTPIIEPPPRMKEQFVRWLKREKSKAKIGVSPYCAIPLRDLFGENFVETYPRGWSRRHLRKITEVVNNHQVIEIIEPGDPVIIKKKQTTKKEVQPEENGTGEVTLLKKPSNQSEENGVVNLNKRNKKNDTGVVTLNTKKSTRTIKFNRVGPSKK